MFAKTWLFTLLLITAALVAPADAPLNDKTYWFGNSFSGGKGDAARWMMQSLDDFAVHGERIYGLTLWDERGGEATIYTTGGEFMRATPGWHSWGYRGGTAVTADDKYVYYSMGHDPHDGGGRGYAGVARYTLDGQPAGWPSATNGHRLVVGPDYRQKPTGLAVTDGLLYVADPASERIAVFSTADLSPLPDLQFAHAGRLAVDAAPAHSLWVIDTAAHTVRKISRDGKALGVTITDCLDPSALCIDRKNGDLLVADNAPERKQIRRYRADSGKHIAGADFGAPIYTGAHPGAVQPARFYAITGLATDAAGNLYVGGWEYGAKLHKFDAAGKEVWVLKGLEFVSCASADPGDDASFYSPGHRYLRDDTRPPGATWSEQAITLNPLRYPQDPRLRVDPWMAAHMYRLRGRKIMLLKPQMSPNMYFYRFDGEIAVPAAMYFPFGVSKPTPAKNFSARWSGYLQPRITGKHVFTAVNNDGLMLYLDGQAVIDSWTSKGVSEKSGEIELQAGKRYALKVEYCQHAGGGCLQLYWQQPGQQARAIIPSEVLYCSTGKTHGLLAEFFHGVTLGEPAGNKESNPDNPATVPATKPAQTRFDATIDYPVFCGNENSPDFGVPRPSWPPNHPDGPFIWSDANGDGAMRAEEYTPLPAGSQAAMVDVNGDLWVNCGGWQAGKGNITRLPLAGLNRCGAPTWDVAKSTSTTIPADTGIQYLSKLFYEPILDRMYLGVWTKEHPFTGGGWEQMSVGPVIQCFSNWSTYPKLAWETTENGLLPTSPSKLQKAWSIEPDYLFAAYTRQFDQLAVDVYRTGDGHFMGTLLPTAEIGGSTGWIDMNDAVQTHRCADGTYLVFVEEVWMAKGLYFRWKP